MMPYTDAHANAVAHGDEDHDCYAATLPVLSLE